MHPHDRLQREGLGERLVRARSLIRTLMTRDKPLAVPRVIPGEGMSVRGCEIKYRRVPFEPGPNAPLLKRIVKYPYTFSELGRPRRVPVPMGLDERETREAFPRPMAMVATFRGVRVSGGPLKSLALRVKPLTKAPSIEIWLSNRVSS
jgi:hypothetical protein